MSLIVILLRDSVHILEYFPPVCFFPYISWRPVYVYLDFCFLKLKIIFSCSLFDSLTVYCNYFSISVNILFHSGWFLWSDKFWKHWPSLDFNRAGEVKKAVGRERELIVWVKGEYSNTWHDSHCVCISQMCWTGTEFTFRVVFGRHLGLGRQDSWLLWWILSVKINLFASDIWLLEGLLCLADYSSELRCCLVNWERVCQGLWASSILYRIQSYTQLYYLRLLAGRNYCHDWYRRPSGKTLQVRRNFDPLSSQRPGQSCAREDGLGNRSPIPVELNRRKVVKGYTSVPQRKNTLSYVNYNMVTELGKFPQYFSALRLENCSNLQNWLILLGARHYGKAQPYKVCFITLILQMWATC